MLGSPAEVTLASGHSAAHIISISTVPLTAAIRSATPRVSAMPTPSNASMNSQLAQPAPAQAWKVDSKGPTATALRNPLVGEPRRDLDRAVQADRLVLSDGHDLLPAIAVGMV